MAVSFRTISFKVTRDKSDHELVQQVSESQDEHACKELMKRYKRALFFKLLKMVHNHNDAENLTIEAFAKSFINIHQYNSEYAFSTWLYRIANNNCIDFLRKKQRQRHLISIDENFEGKNSNHAHIELRSRDLTPEEILIKKEQIKNLYKMIEKLKPSFRSIIKLRYFKEYSYKEISENMDIPLGTAKVSLMRAKKALYELYN